MCVCKDSAAPAHAYTRTQARGATPELRRVADTTSHGLSVGMLAAACACVCSACARRSFLSHVWNVAVLHSMFDDSVHELSTEDYFQIVEDC